MGVENGPQRPTLTDSDPVESRRTAGVLRLSTAFDTDLQLLSKDSYLGAVFGT
jgi:hypothetical protein